MSVSQMNRAACARFGILPRTVQILAAWAFVAGLALVAQDSGSQTPAEDGLRKAEKLFREEHWAEARAAYDEARDLETDWRSPRVRLAVEGAVACSLKLKLWDDAIGRAQEFIAKTKGSLAEAVGERFLAGLYMTVPHYGTKRGATYLRGEHTQGVYVSSWRKDRREAIGHYERARELLIVLAEKIGPADTPDAAKQRTLIEAERIGVNFDLVTSLAQRDAHRYGPWGWCGWWWDSVLEPEEDSEAVEEADYEEPRWWHYGGDQEPPTGIPLDADGKPQFVQTPKAYASGLGEGPKIRFLLDEVQRLDTSETKDDAARALLRWAMIARLLYGPETANQWNAQRVRYDRFGQPLPSQPDRDQPQSKIWELEDDEALTIVGGRLRVITLPASESPVSLLRALEKKYPDSSVRPEAHYARALYFQTRQQFPQALDEYAALIETHPKHRRAADAQRQVNTIKQPDAILGSSGVHLPGGKPMLSFTHRNTDKIEFTACAVDLVKYVQDRLEDKSEQYWNYRNISWDFFQKERWKAYTGKQVAAWTQTVELLEGHRTAEGSTPAPLSEPGAYLVEARAGERDDISRVLVLVTDIAIVQKNAVNKGLIYVADARTGQPLADKAVRIYEHWTEWKDSKSTLHWTSSVQTTNQDGVIEYTRKETQRSPQVDAVVAGEGGRMAFSFFQSWSEHDPGYYWEEGPRYYVVTDRPVYRPGQAVKFRVWQRQLRQRAYQPPQADQSMHIEIYDARNNKVQELQLKTDEYGCAGGEYTLDDEPPLGVWHLRVDHYDPDARRHAGGLFRVEEYKKPEFEVTVKPAETQARLGEKIKATVSARYYFGAPVARGQVTYKVFREEYQHVYWGPGEYDWLYGQGYGRYYYAYPWLPWWGRWGCFICCDGWWPGYPWAWIGQPAWYFPWGYYGDTEGQWRHQLEGGRRNALRELVAQGNAELKPDGTYELEIDTARALQEQADRDHRYTVEVEVRDESRRTIEGQGSVIVTRQEFFAFVETDGGWYRPQNEAHVNVRTLTADNVPVAARGEVIVYRIRYGGADNRDVREEVVKRWKAETDADGRLELRYPIPGEGQFRIAFKTQDSWGEEVLGNAVFWATGPKFDGRVYRFNDLEIIADKRTYQVGETAHLLINVAQSNSRILFSDHVSRGTLLDYRFIDVPARSTVIDLPIEARHVPNFYVEATLVRNGRVHTEAQELFVPPVQGLLTVEVETDKAEYKPGEKGTVRVRATDATGEPVAGQVALTAYDESVTYIQDEFGPSPRVFFWGQKRHHAPYVHSSVENQFSPMGAFTRPEQSVYSGGMPEGWQGWWSLDAEGLSLSGGFGGGGMGGAGLDSFGMRGDHLERAAGMASSSVSGPMAANEPAAKPMSGLMENVDLSAPMDAAKSPEERAKSQREPGVTGDLVEPEVRTNFADTALWLPSLELGPDGTAETEITFPQSLTTWRLRGYALTKTTQVGDATAKATTTKDLIVRLQVPRFFVERDEVVLSANVHNYLRTEKKVRAELILPGNLFEPMDTAPASRNPHPASRDAHPASRNSQPDDLHLVATATVAAEGEHRFDWPVRVRQAGLARITVKALTDEDSDGMRLAFPVLVHGINKTIAQSGSYRVAQTGQRTMELDLPQEIDPEQTKLEVTLAPSLAGVMIDALPYLAGYPYGCVEQTLSRFYPTVLVAGTLKKMGLDLETIGNQRRQMHVGDLQNRFGRGSDSPVFDSAEMDQMVRAGLNRIYGFQQNDGGWGWWRNDESSPYQTAYVLQGLHAARQAQVNVDGGVYERGLNFLQNAISKELAKPKDEQRIGHIQTQAYLAYVLSLEHRLNQDERKTWLNELYASRGELNNYGRALLALAMHNEQRTDEAQTLLRNVLQFVERDDGNETAWVRTPAQCWWFWWNNDIETNAWTLKAIVAIDPQNDLAPRLVKWLLNNRRHGYYWRSTRDTALTIAAMVDYMQASGEAAPDYALTVSIDGRPMKEIRVTKENLFTFDNRLVLSGLHVQPGPHKVTLAKKGEGALYYSCYLSYFTKEEDVKGAGNEIFVKRDYFKLVPKNEQVQLADAGTAASPPGLRPQPLEKTGRTELRAGYTRVPLKTGDAVTSGDRIEVVLTITSKNVYDFLAFEDMKPAGCEPVELRSGGRWAGGLCPHVELRDEKVVFFIGLLEQGTHVLRYQLRAETPGKFHALPTTGFAMYAPEVRAISDEMRLEIADRQ